MIVKKVKAQTEVRFQNAPKSIVYMRKGEVKEVRFDALERYLSLSRLGVIKETVPGDKTTRRKLPDPFARIHKENNRKRIVEKVEKEVKVELMEVDLSDKDMTRQGSPR